MNEQTFTFHEDPGHGWLRVPRKLLVELGIEKQITPYSFQQGESVYLEEDCDAGTFIEAMKKRGIRVKFDSRFHENTASCRYYESYSPLS